MSFLGIDLGPHAAFIIASYAVGLVVIVSLIVWVTQDYRTQRRRLVALEERGVTRRSQRAVTRAS
jgi:heme exporter protein D